jgi:GT2 family glycosyltransferase
MCKTFIILINYNNHDDTLKCLESISQAGYKKNVLVVDNNSTTPGIDLIKAQFPNTVLIKNKENVGFGRANNIGIQWVLNNTKCKYVFILNNDTIIEKTTIPLLIKSFNFSIRIAMVTPKIVFTENPHILWYGGGDIDWKKGVPKTPGFMGSASTESANLRRYVSFASGCAMLFKTSVLKELNGFDFRYFMYCEDMELCLRVQKKGWKILYEPSAIIKHSVQGSTRTDRNQYLPMLHYQNPNLNFYMYHMLKNRLLTIHKHANLKNKFVFSMYFPIYFIAKFFICKLYKSKNISKVILKAIKDYYLETKIKSSNSNDIN